MLKENAEGPNVECENARATGAEGINVDSENVGATGAEGLNVESENFGATGAEVECEKDGDNGVEVEIEKDGATSVDVEIEKDGDNGVKVESEKGGATSVDVETGNEGPTEVESDNVGANGVDLENEKARPTEQVDGESVQSGTNEEVNKDKGVQSECEEECIELNEDSDDSALNIHFGDSDDELMLNDAFDDEGEGVHENAENADSEGEEPVVNENAENVAEGPVAEAPTKKRGRARKVHENVAEAPIKKRGRPRKVHVAPEVSESDMEELNEDEESDEDNDDLQTEADGESSKVADKGLSDDELYDSDELVSGSDTDEDGSTKSKFPTFKLPSKMKDYKWEVGTYFASKQEFQDAMRTYAIHSGRQLKFKKSDKVRVRVACKPTCPWNAFCAKIPNQETW